MHNWDDEENIKSITEGDLGSCVQSSVDVASHKVKGSASSVAHEQSNKDNCDSMEEDEIAEAL